MDGIIVQVPCRCKKCSHMHLVKPLPQEIAFAKATHSDSLQAIWICPKCGEDNMSEILIQPQP